VHDRWQCNANANVVDEKTPVSAVTFAQACRATPGISNALETPL
jgi:hypothetical protein